MHLFILSTSIQGSAECAGTVVHFMDGQYSCKYINIIEMQQKEQCIDIMHLCQLYTTCNQTSLNY